MTKKVKPHAPIRIGSRLYEVDWGHLAVLILIAAFVVIYLFDTRAVSLSLNNLLFVQPASIIALILCALVLPQIFRRVTDGEADEVSDQNEVEERPRESWRDLRRIAILAVAFGVFAFGLDRGGFDVMSWMLITVGLYVCGERNWVTLALYPPIATAILIYGFRELIPYPITTLIL